MSLLLVALTFTMLLVPVVSTQAMKPLRGTMELQFNLGWPGPQAEIPDWIGYNTIDGISYGMLFFAIGSGKPFTEDPSDSVHFFEEIWAIYEWIHFEFDENGFLIMDTFETGPVLIWGYDVGITNLKNSKYHMNGNVEFTEPGWEMYLGRNVFMSGIIEWYPFGAPQYAPGTFRIN